MTGYYLGVFFGWFHLQQLTPTVRNTGRELQNEKFFPSVGFEPLTFHLQSERAKHCAMKTNIYRGLKSWLRLGSVPVET